MNNLNGNDVKQFFIDQLIRQDYIFYNGKDIFQISETDFKESAV